MLVIRNQSSIAADTACALLRQQQLQALAFLYPLRQA